MIGFDCKDCAHSKIRLRYGFTGEKNEMWCDLTGKSCIWERATPAQPYIQHDGFTKKIPINTNCGYFGNHFEGIYK